MGSREHPLVAPEITVPSRVDEVARPGDDLNGIIRAAEGSGHFTLGIEGVHEVGIDLQKRYGGHWAGEDMSISLVGMTEDAEVRGVSWHEHEDGDVDHLGVYRMNVRNRKGWRSPFWGTEKTGHLIFHQVGMLPDLSPGAGYEGAKWGFKIIGCDLLQIDECPRAMDPITGLQSRYWEHWGYFVDVLESYITHNDISGGNRTGFQDRTPGFDQYRQPVGPKLCEGNVCHDYGWDWPMMNGGSAITYWESRGPLVIRNNEVTNPKYGCLTIAHQAPDQKPFTVSPEGHVHEDVWVEGNLFHSEAGDREATAISSAVDVMVRNNDLKAKDYDLYIDAGYPSKLGAPPCKNVTVKGTDDVGQWYPEEDRYRPWIGPTS